MPKGVSGKGYKMTAGRKAVLELLVEEGGALKSSEGKATSLVHGLLGSESSVASLNACLKELHNLDWIHRNTNGRRTYEIAITERGREVLKNETGIVGPSPTAALVEPPTEVQETESDEDWDWAAAQDDQALPDGIDYEVLLAVFIKAALRGMEGPSNGEVDYLKQQLAQANEKNVTLQEQVDRFRAEAASAGAERDQLQKNLNIVMSRAEKVGAGRGSDPIRKLLNPQERQALDQLMRQIPTRRGGE